MRPIGIKLTPEIEKFLGAANSKRYSARSTIMREGDASSSIYYILEGSITVLIEDDDGHEIILDYLGAGQFFGELGLFTDEGRSAWVTARTECKVAMMSYEKFNGLCRETPELLIELTRQIAQRLRNTSRKVGDLALLDVTGRMAHALLNLANHSDAITHPDGMMIRITREELGRLVGCSREMAGKVLKELDDQGLVHADGKNLLVYGPQ
jgi:CRP/FNR family transcriptional regulator, cyclic AMP receptor protein